MTRLKAAVSSLESPISSAMRGPIVIGSVPMTGGRS